MNNLYKVTWDIELEADSPDEAAKLCLKWIKDPESVCTIFDVVDIESGEHTEIDLYGVDVDD